MLKLTDKNYVDMSSWPNSENAMKRRLADLVQHYIDNLPVELRIEPDASNRPYIMLSSESTSLTTIPIDRAFYTWLTGRIRFVKRRCFCRISDRMIAATVFKKKGLRVTNICLITDD